MIYDTNNKDPKLAKYLPPNRTHAVQLTSWYGPSNFTVNPTYEWLDFTIKFGQTGDLQICDMSEDLVKKLPFFSKYKKVHFKMVDDSDSSSSDETPTRKKVIPVVITKQNETSFWSRPRFHSSSLKLRKYRD